MNPRPQKPRIVRPPAQSRPGAVFPAGAPVIPVAPASKLGLWISLGFHACLIAAACTVTWMIPAEKGKGNDETAGDRGDFEMPISSRKPQASEFEVATAPESPPAPQLPAPQVSLIAVADLPALRAQPLFEPIALVTTAKPPTPPATSTASISTEKSPGPAKMRSGKAGGKAGARTGGKKGRGEGKRTERPTSASPPQLLSSPPPRYPAEARAAKKTGKVGVLVRVRTNGSAASTSIYRSSGNPQLDHAAVTAARSWKFSQTPSLEAGATIAVVVQVTFDL